MHKEINSASKLPLTRIIFVFFGQDHLHPVHFSKMPAIVSVLLFLVVFTVPSDAIARAPAAPSRLQRPAPFRKVQHAVPIQRQVPLGMEKQCVCEEIKPCKERYTKTFEPCMDQCQGHIRALGGNYAQVKQCFRPKENLLKVAMKCTENQHKNACNKEPKALKYVPKRYAQTLENAAMAEIDRMIGRMGIDKTPTGKKLVSVGKKLFGCIKRCMAKSAANCERSLSCGLLLPSDREVVMNTKQCAIKSGFNTASAQQLCQCAATAGVKDLKSLCSKIIIS